MNEYEARQEARRERYEELAEKNRQESSSRSTEAMTQLRMIPPGQPILVGHHSERGHRAHLKRIDNHFRKASEASDKAEHYERKAKGVGKGGISSDDPEAISKLKAKLASLEDNQEYMKKANKAIRLKDQEKGNAIMLEMGLKPELIKELRAPDFCGRVGFAPYSLQNNNGNMRRIRERIKELESKKDLVTQEIQSGDVTVVQNVEENRVQIFFPGKPSEQVRTWLKSRGFRWARYNKAWQRHNNNAGIYNAKNFLEWLDRELEGQWQ